MQFLPEWAPSIHPLIVHFPIALITVAIAMDLLSLFVKSYQIKFISVVLYFLAGLGAIASFFSGRQAADSLTIPDGNYDVYTAISAHADMAYYTVLFLGVYSVLRLIIHRFAKDKNRLTPLILFVAGLVGFFLVAQTADKGAKLVYRYGLGTKLFSKAQDRADIIPEKNGLIQKENRSWEWIAKKNATSVLESQFVSIKGNVDNLELNDENGFLSITLSSPESYFFVYDENVSDIIVSAEVNLDSLKGRFSLTHHVSDNTNFDFFDINGNEIRLGRIEDGKTTIFDQSNFSVNGWINIKAVGTKGHFRGYINDKLVVHGHGKDLPPGNAGFVLSGEGIFKVKNIKADFISDTKMIPEETKH